MNNNVTLLGFYGGDKRASISAWQSTTEELGIELPENISDRVDVIFEHIAKSKKKNSEELLIYLASHGHETPFEKCILDFQITGELCSHIHSLKHRLSAINSESARYKEFEQDKYYIPDDWLDIEITDDIFLDTERIAVVGEKWVDVLKNYSDAGFALYHQAITDLTPHLGRKRAKESARYFLGYNTQLNYDWQMNFRSFVNIQQLRNSSNAQREIHQITNTMLHLVETIPGNPFEYSLKAFNLKSDSSMVLT